MRLSSVSRPHDMARTLLFMYIHLAGLGNNMAVLNSVNIARFFGGNAVVRGWLNTLFTSYALSVARGLRLELFGEA